MKWQYIKTHSGDDTIVDLWINNPPPGLSPYRVTDCRWRQIRQWEAYTDEPFVIGVFGWFAGNGRRVENPSHWMNRPAAPDAA